MSVSRDDLAIAANWLDQYDGDGDNDDERECSRAAAGRVAEYLRAEIFRRNREAAIMAMVAQTGATRAAARRALDRAMARKDTA